MLQPNDVLNSFCQTSKFLELAENYINCAAVNTVVLDNNRKMQSATVGP